jgi:hypothetical protein
MAYIVTISTGRGKEKTIMQSTPLKLKEDVVRWIKRNPVGNFRTKVVLFNTLTRKRIIDSKMRFYSLKNW